MKLSSLLPNLNPDELSGQLRKDLEAGLSPVLDRADNLNEKLDRLISVAERLESLLKKFEPVANLFRRIPFLR